MTELQSSTIDRAGVQQRVQALRECGFTDRQARFLVLVMRHAGVCVPRQYSSFAGIANGGRRCNAFFARLLTRGFAREIRCVHNRAHLYHVHHKPLYALIGEVTSRCRRAVSARLTIERLMLLDAVLAMPDVEWLTTPAERLDYLARVTADAGLGAVQPAPAVDTSAALRELSTAFPIGMQSRRLVLMYLAAAPDLDGFRTFLQMQLPLLRVAPMWTLRLAFPRPLDRLYNAYQEVIREELESPLHPATISELKWYFEHRRVAAREAVHSTTQKILDAAAQAFAKPRFTAMYQRWLRQGNAVFEGPSSPAIADALSSGQGRVESMVLNCSYRHLSPLVADTSLRPESKEEGLRRGNERGNRVSRALNARPQPPGEEAELTIPEQQARDWRRLVEAHNAQRAQEFRR